MSAEGGEPETSRSTGPGDWTSMVEAAGPASLLVIIEYRMGARLRERLSPEDIWQEALLSAWRDRDACRATTARAFRAWLLSVIDHRILAAADHFAATKRGGAGLGRGSEADAGGAHSPGHNGSPHESDFAATSTPSRLASSREQAAIMRQALDGLEEDVRAVVCLRLFEQLPITTIAERLGIGPSAVRHRFRRGVEHYHRLLRAALESRATMMSVATPAALSSSPWPGGGVGHASGRV